MRCWRSISERRRPRSLVCIKAVCSEIYNLVIKARIPRASFSDLSVSFAARGFFELSRSEFSPREVKAGNGWRSQSLELSYCLSLRRSLQNHRQTEHLLICFMSGFLIISRIQPVRRFYCIVIILPTVDPKAVLIMVTFLKRNSRGLWGTKTPLDKVSAWSSRWSNHVLKRLIIVFELIEPFFSIIYSLVTSTITSNVAASASPTSTVHSEKKTTNLIAFQVFFTFYFRSWGAINTFLLIF